MVVFSDGSAAAAAATAVASCGGGGDASSDGVLADVVVSGGGGDIVVVAAVDGSDNVGGRGTYRDTVSELAAAAAGHCGVVGGGCVGAGRGRLFTRYDTPPRWPSGQGVRLESGRSWVRIPLATGFFRGRVIPATQKLALQWLPFEAPSEIGSVLGLVGPVSENCDWVR